jgi:hypothetical protein
MSVLKVKRSFADGGFVRKVLVKAGMILYNRRALRTNEGGLLPGRERSI